MKNIILVLAILGLSVAYTNCSNTSFTAIGVNSASSASAGDYASKNVVAVDVGNCGYVNEPCVTVTICTPGTTNCQTIPNVLLDTGSYGLRLFSSVVTIPLTQSTNSSGLGLAECTSYADGTSQWGPVKTADVILGQERSATVPIQVIDANYSTHPTSCSNPENDPNAAGYNGILGVGLFTDDCGSSCVSYSNNGLYYACSSSSCSGSTIPIASQVSNPVSFMPYDNNGIVLQLPAVSSSGAVSVSGSMYLGIGTQSNNSASSVRVFGADGYGNFRTIYNGTSYSTAFIDSGSNGLFFPAGSTVVACSSSSIAYGFFCPASLLSLSAIQMPATGSAQSTVSFQIMDASQALASSNPNAVFNDLGGSMSGDFDWGLPFFLGRSVFVGTSGKTSPLGTGPYWAY
jgi:hypothetical protein